MDMKNLLRFLPIIMLTTTYTTIGMENKPDTNQIPPYYNMNYNTNNYYAPYTNNTYYGTTINNQYPIGYGAFPAFWPQNPQYFPTPNIQNSQYNQFQQCYYNYPVFNNVHQNFGIPNAETSKFVGDNKNKCEKSNNKTSNTQYNKPEQNTNTKNNKLVQNNNKLKQNNNDNKLVQSNNIRNNNLSNSNIITKLSLNSPSYIDKKTRLDNFFTIPLNNLNEGSESEQMSNISEDNPLIQSSIMPIINGYPEAKQKMKNYITNCINKDKYKYKYKNEFIDIMKIIVKKNENITKLQKSIMNSTKSSNKDFLSKFKKTAKQNKMKKGIEIMDRYYQNKVNKYKTIVEQLTNNSYSNSQNILVILNTKQEQEMQNLKMSLNKVLFNNLKRNRAVKIKKIIKTEIDGKLSLLEEQHNIIYTQHDIYVFFKDFYIVQNYISRIKNKNNKEELQQRFDEFIKKLNNKRKIFNKTDNLYDNIIFSIYELLLSSYNIDNKISKSHYKTYYESSFWKLNKYETILQNNYKETICNIINIIRKNLNKYLKKINDDPKNNNQFYNRFNNLNKDYNEIFNKYNSNISNINSINNKTNDLSMIKKFKDIKVEYIRLNEEINKTKSYIKNKNYLLESIELIQKDIDENIELLEQLNPNCKSEIKTEDKKVESNNISIQNEYKNLSINKINSINFSVSKEKMQEIEEKKRINEITKNHVTFLQKNKKTYNELITKLNNDILNNKTNINEYETSVRNYFVKSIDKNINNIQNIIKDLLLAQKNNKKEYIVMDNINKYIVYTNLIDMYNTTKYFFKYYKILHNNTLSSQKIDSIYSKIHNNIINEFSLKNMNIMDYYNSKEKNNCFYRLISELSKLGEKKSLDDRKNETIQKLNFDGYKSKILKAICEYRTNNIGKIINKINNNMYLINIFDDIHKYVNAIINSTNKMLDEYGERIDKYIPIHIISLNHSILQLNILLFDKKLLFNKEHMINTVNELLQDLQEFENVIENLKLVEQPSTTDNNQK